MLVEQKLDVAQEVYAAVTYVRASPAVILSASGGVDVEKACHESQEGVLVEPVNILRGLQPEQAADLARRAGLDAGVADVLLKLYRMFIDFDATLAEINPLGANPRGPMDRRRRQGRDRRRRDVPPDRA